VARQSVQVARQVVVTCLVVFSTIGEIMLNKITDLQKIEQLLMAKEKICLFIDNSNLFGAMQEFSQNDRIDYIKLKEFLAHGRTIASARFYYSEPPFPRDNVEPEVMQAALESVRKRKSFYYVLERSGYTTICLPQRSNHVNSFVEKGLDTELVYDMCAMSRDGRIDTFILVAGDEDYARIVSRLRQDTGVKVEVAFFDAQCSYKLKEAATTFIDLGQQETRELVFRGQLADE
jgi:uncharacterized LabA/DUF88 family protein